MAKQPPTTIDIGSNFHIEFAKPAIKFDPKDRQAFYDEVTGNLMLVRSGNFSMIDSRKPGSAESSVFRYAKICIFALVYLDRMTLPLYLMLNFLLIGCGCAFKGMTSRLYVFFTP